MPRGKRKVVGRCKLCRTIAELRYSHIIPEFMYKDLYGPTHTIHLASTKDWGKSELLQKGAREHLLCEYCEQKFSKYEKHAADVWFQNVEILSHGRLGFSGRVDYKLFKLFQLSILWRMDVTSMNAFNRLHLGKHERIIRRMLLRDDPGKYDEYGCLIVRPNEYQNIYKELILHGFTARLSGVDIPVLAMGSVLWIYCVSRAPIDPRQAQCFLQPDGEIRVLMCDPGIGKQIVNHFVDSIRIHKARIPS